MNKVKNFIALIMAIISLSLVSVSAQNYSASGKGGRTVEQQIFKKLIGLPRYGVFDFISYEVQGGTVVLAGKTYSLGTKNQAESAVKKVPGISNVVNNIEELPPSPFDDQIRRDALGSFSSKGLYRYFWEPNPQVRIIVDRGHVTLEGYVANSGDSNIMNILANGVSGAFSVTNHLIIGEDQRSK